MKRPTPLPTIDRRLFYKPEPRLPRWLFIAACVVAFICGAAVSPGI